MATVISSGFSLIATLRTYTHSSRYWRIMGITYAPPATTTSQHFPPSLLPPILFHTKHTMQIKQHLPTRRPLANPHQPRIGLAFPGSLDLLDIGDDSICACPRAVRDQGRWHNILNLPDAERFGDVAFQGDLHATAGARAESYVEEVWDCGKGWVWLLASSAWVRGRVWLTKAESSEEKGEIFE